ncbi:cytochrome d ubiquinol oxidase subunit II [Loigolactobacillus iwatensis]|uniref:cytochrome d ubiquinol oxidase subunit II n=1 Tax=Loigolactobacillus iwatensis TaxID=1267156 RepID=UPI000F7F2FA8|nr:cytochrome d ubiquinol oxidase subunit II [Loigolactobacillus iwatensis]
MSSLQLLWFFLIGLLFAVFFLLEGFDYGVGMSLRFLAKDEQECDSLIQTIGPHWDGNEVWLITAGGAMFASFPYWYASLFSGFYILLFLILFGLIIRGVSFEFRTHVDTRKGRKLWEVTLFTGSLMAPFLFGMMFTDMVKGMPIDAQGNLSASVGDYINLFSIVGGVAVALLCLLHGLNYIRLSTLGALRQRAQKLAKLLYPVLFVGLVVYAALLLFQTDFFTARPVSSWTLLILIVLASVVATYGAYADKEWLSFIASGGTLILLVALLFNGLFPRVMVATNPAHSILIKNASSSEYTLKIMTIVACILVPIVIVYTVWSYFVFNKRVTTKKVVE